MQKTRIFCKGSLAGALAPINWHLFMRVSALICMGVIFVTNLLIASPGRGQENRKQTISLSCKNTSLFKVIKDINAQSEVTIMYELTPELRNQKITALFINKSIDEIMDELVKGRNLRWSRQKDLIILEEAPEVPGQGTNQHPPLLATLPPPITVRGQVVNDQGEPLAGASIKVQGKSAGTSTDSSGYFTIELPEGGGMLMVSFVGHETRNYRISQPGDYRIELQLSNAQTEEVVVVGYGVKRKASLTGSVVDVDTKTFADLPVVNPYQAMQGRTPGLRVTQSSGQPGGEGMSLNLRGPNSFSSDNSPLVIVDGIVGSIADLDPSFIQTITVLKDASAAAIYGARAANGVVLVTTKKGAAGTALRVEYTGKYINQSRTMWPKRIWNSVEYMEMLNVAIANAGGGNGQIPYPDSIINLYRNPGDLYANNNYEDFMIRNININSHNLSFSGRTEKTTYQAGFGAWNQDGIVKGFNYKKHTAMFNMESRLSEKLKFGITLNGIIDNRKETAWGSTDMMLSILSQMPTYKPYIADGSGKYSFRGWADGNQEYPGKSPIGVSENGGRWTNGVRLQSTAYAEYEIFRGLTWFTKGGIRYASNDGKTQLPLIPVYNYFTSAFEQYADNRGTIDLSQQITKSMYQTIYSTLNYKLRVAGGHFFEVLAGLSQEKLKDENIGGTRRGFASPLLDVLSAGPTLGQTVFAELNEYRLRSYFGRLNYNYKDKYLLEGVVRRDGSSRFVQGHNYGTFPSLSVGWRLSEEKFIKNALPVFSNLKFRASYGELGNDAIGNYPYQSTLNLGSNYYFESFYPGVSRSALANTLVSWETTKASNLGIDFDLVNGVLYGSLDIFKKRTEGILRLSQLPGYVGLGAPFVNEGVVDNKGYEITLGHRGRGREFNYSVDINLSHFNNRLVKFGAPVIGTNLMKEGVEMNRYYMYQADGIYQDEAEIDRGPTPRWPSVPGDVKIKDVDGDGVITPDDRVEVKGVNPDLIYGMSLSASFRGFDINVLFQGESGRKVLVNDWVLPFSGRTTPLEYWKEGAWTPGSGINDKPRIVHGNGPLGQSNREVSTFWLRDVSFMRLKFLTLGYSLPNSWLSKYGIGRVRIFANGENLLTFTGFEFGDPEGNAGWTYPTLKSLNFGLNVQF